MSKCTIFNRQKLSAYIGYVCCVLMIITTGCGDEATHSTTPDNITTDAASTGSATLTIQWQRASTASFAADDPTRQALDNCTAAGVAFITARVYDDSNTDIANSDWWSCEDRGGRIERIPAGTNRRIAVLGWDTNREKILYQGHTDTGIDITAGELTDAGAIVAHSFVPTGLEATTNSSSRIGLVWSRFGDNYEVSGYRIYRDGAAIATSNTVSYEDVNIPNPNTQYCYTVAAYDVFGNESGQSDEDCATTETSDNDGDGYSEAQGDCDDTNEDIYPGATEVCGDGIDQDCNGSDLSCDDIDNDGDGYSEIQGDCDDANADVNPGATEVCNGINDNCAGGIDEGLSTDADGDGHYTTNSCATPADDCDDTDDRVYPGATEICGDRIDQDCSGRDLSCDDVDNDGDGFSETQGDCDDTDENVHPGATEVCNGINDNCTGGIDEGLSTDADRDGHYTTNSCATPADDCDDNNRNIHPGATEVCGDGIDQDCNGSDLSCDDVDNDGDGYSETQGDCDDADENVHPGATEACNGVDDDCDDSVDEGLTSDADRDGYTSVDSCQGSADDCNDNNASVNPGVTEVCHDNIDNNCNGTTDENCPDCYPNLTTPTLEFTGKQTYYFGSGYYTVFSFTVINRNAYPNSMFELSTAYPSCQGNTGSRSAVEINDGNNNLILEHCDFTSRNDLQAFSFIINGGDPQPQSVYIRIVDRECDHTYVSNIVTVNNVAPVIENSNYTLINVNDESCDLSLPLGSLFEVTFDYIDEDGDGPINISDANLAISYDFPFGVDGRFDNYTWNSNLSGSGLNGSATTRQCYRFGSNSYVDVTMTIEDLSGATSNGLTVRIDRPSGSN